MPNNPHKPNPLQRLVLWLARQVSPTHKPLWPAIFGTLCFIGAWELLPAFFDAGVQDPIIAGLLVRMHAYQALHGFCLVLTSLGTLIGLMLWARVVQLCWPDYFNAHDDKHT